MTDPPDAPAADAPRAGGADRPGSGPRIGKGFVIALVVTFVVVLGLGVGLRAVARPGVGEGDLHGAAFDPPRPRPEFTLTDLHGEPYDFAEQTSGHLTLLFFGYTHCPDVCPITMTTLTAALGELDVAADVVFVTVDPQRDTDEVLTEWLGAFDDRYVGLRGSAEEIDAALAAVDLPPPTFSEPEADGSYAVGHSSRVFLIGADDEVKLVYPFGVRENEWVEDLTIARERGWTTAPSGAQTGDGT